MLTLRDSGAGGDGYSREAVIYGAVKTKIGETVQFYSEKVYMMNRKTASSFQI